MTWPPPCGVPRTCMFPTSAISSNRPTKSRRTIKSASKRSLSGSAWLAWAPRGKFLTLAWALPVLAADGDETRLQANDRVDPYVAVYEAPSPASIADVTHIRWKGLMDNSFVRSVIDTAVYAFLLSFTLSRVDAMRMANESRT